MITSSTTPQTFYARTYLLGAKSGSVLSLLCLLIAAILFLNNNQQAFRYVIYAALLFLFTRHYKWPLIIVEPHRVSVLKSFFSKTYLTIEKPDFPRTEITDKRVTFYPSGRRSIPVPRRSIKKEDWDRFVQAVKNTCLEKNEQNTIPVLWKKLPIPFLHERIFAFSLPINNKILVIAQDESEELFFLNISPFQVKNEGDTTHTIRDFQIAQCKINQQNPQAKEGEQKIVLNGERYSLLGLMGGKPILKNNLGEELRLTLATKGGYACSFSILKNGKETFKYSFQDMSGDWTYVTFSPDNKYVLLGNPYEFSLFERTKTTAEEEKDAEELNQLHSNTSPPLTKPIDPPLVQTSIHTQSSEHEYKLVASEPGEAVNIPYKIFAEFVDSNPFGLISNPKHATSDWSDTEGRVLEVFPEQTGGFVSSKNFSPEYERSILQFLVQGLEKKFLHRKCRAIQLMNRHNFIIKEPQELPFLLKELEGLVEKNPFGFSNQCFSGAWTWIKDDNAVCEVDLDVPGFIVTFYNTDEILTKNMLKFIEDLIGSHPPPINKFLYLFGYQTPADQYYAKKNNQDSQSTFTFWIEADSKEKAIYWGQKVAEAYVQTMYANIKPEYSSLPLTPWHEGLIGDPKEWTEEQLKNLTTVPFGTMPDVKLLIESLHGKGPW